MTMITSPEPPQRIGAAIGELRRISGLAWDQLCRLFQMDRPSFHAWASGQTMTPADEERLRQVLAAIRRIDRGASDINRIELFTK